MNQQVIEGEGIDEQLGALADRDKLIHDFAYIEIGKHLLQSCGGGEVSVCVLDGNMAQHPTLILFAPRETNHEVVILYMKAEGGDERAHLGEYAVGERALADVQLIG